MNLKILSLYDREVFSLVWLSGCLGKEKKLFVLSWGSWNRVQNN